MKHAWDGPASKEAGSELHGGYPLESFADLIPGHRAGDPDVSPAGLTEFRARQNQHMGLLEGQAAEFLI